MKTNIHEEIAYLKTKKELVLTFLKHHNQDISELILDNLQDSDNETDKQIYKDICSYPDWKKILQDLAELQIPDCWQADIAPLSENEQNVSDQIKNLPEDKVSELPKKNADPKDPFTFQYDVAYFFTPIPCHDGSSSSIISESFAIIDDKLTIQEDVNSTDWVTHTEEIPKTDAITGSFDNSNPEDLVLYQINDKISLDEIDYSSVKKYKSLYTGNTNFYTRSQACDILKIQGKEQVVTVLLNGTQIGIEVYYFDNGKKEAWGTSSLFNHNIDYTDIRSFNISVSEVLPNNTIEVLAVITKSDPLSAGYWYYYKLQTNLIKLVIDVSTKTFKLAANQVLVGPVTLTKNFILPNIEQQIYLLNGFVYLAYLSNDNTISLATLKWNGSAYTQIGKEDYAISLPLFLHDCEFTFYKNGNTFYLMHVFHNGFSDWSFYVEIYESTDNGSLVKVNSVSCCNKETNLVGSFWNLVYVNNFLYLIETGYIWVNPQQIQPARFLYKLTENRKDKSKNIIELLNIQQDCIPHRVYSAYGKLILVKSKGDLKALPPKITSITECLQPIAILDAPPISSLIDYSHGTSTPSLTYSFQNQQSSTKNVETKTERSKSDKLGIGFKFFGLKIGADIDKKITEASKDTHESKFELSQNTEIVTEVQDMTVFLGINFDIYEYPITIGGKDGGSFLFLVPSSGPVLSIDTGQDMFRKVSHQIGNTLSYPSSEPQDFQRILYTNQFSINDSESYTFSVGFKEIEKEANSITNTTTVNKSLSLGLEFPIIKQVAASIKAKLTESFKDEDIEISSFTIEDSFSMKIKISNLQAKDARKSFKMTPYFYIDNSNILRCAYSVEVSAGGSGAHSYWYEHYTNPEYGMVMPFHTESYKDDTRYLLSFDIETKPSELVENPEKLDISVTVHNWSMVSGNNVEVAFYYAKELKKNPLKADLIEIGRKTIELIKPRESTVAGITWINPYLIPIINLVPIYVIIDPDNKQQVIGRDNSFAQMNYPITSLTDVKAMETYLSEHVSS
jgi:hypothetical protein